MKIQGQVEKSGKGELALSLIGIISKKLQKLKHRGTTQTYEWTRIKK